MLTWLLTFWGPSDVSQAPGPLDHVIVLTGASARLGIFLYCLSHSFKRSFGLCCSRRLTDWRILTSEPCAPGKPRLRHMTYYILTRPQYLLLVNLPFGYPVDFLAPFALTIRCGFALLLALALKPARPELLKAHDIEAETRENFDTALASHLCEYAWESYVGPPPPNAVVVSGARTDVDGEYLLEGEHLGAPLYSRSTEILEGGRRLLRKGVNDWEIVAVSGGSTVQMAYVRDEAASPNRITGQWIEWDEEGFGISGRVARDNEVLSVQSSRDSDRTVGRRFEQRGVCPDTDMHWLVVEEGLDGGQVSITVAFRGTSSWQNVLTDAKIGADLCDTKLGKLECPRGGSSRAQRLGRYLAGWSLPPCPSAIEGSSLTETSHCEYSAVRLGTFARMDASRGDSTRDTAELTFDAFRRGRTPF